MDEPCRLRRGEGYGGGDDVGRPRTYKTKKTLLEAVKAYFDAIRCEDALPNGLTAQVWAKSPSLAGLCLHLGIGKSTWARYEKDEELAQATEYARLMMEDYWTGELTGKNATGAKFALSAHYGWTDKAAVEMDGEAGEAVKGAEMSMAEKLALLREVARDFGEERRHRAASDVGLERGRAQGRKRPRDQPESEGNGACVLADAELDRDGQ